jgi:REP element-mobilizing transposase RayT
MTQRQRIDYPKAIHHVTQRGNDRQLLFETPADYQVFLDTLAECVARYRWQVLSYCLMPTHLHLLVQTPGANLSLGMRRLKGSCARKLNAAHDRSGQVFQGRFESQLIEDEQPLHAALAYIALNPVQAGLSARPQDWIWSSHAELAGERRPSGRIAQAEVLDRFATRPATARARYGRMVAALANQPKALDAGGCRKDST